MKLCTEDYIKLENSIKEYYQRGKLIQAKERYIKDLERRLETLEKDMSNIGFFHLKSDLQGVVYDKVLVTGGQLPCSDMDRQIERIYFKLEQEKEHLTNEILLNNISIRDMKKENDMMEQALSMLNEQAQQILLFKFDKEYSYEEIANNLPLSKSNIRRKMIDILNDLSLWISYLKNSGTK